MNIAMPTALTRSYKEFCSVFDCLRAFCKEFFVFYAYGTVTFGSNVCKRARGRRLGTVQGMQWGLFSC